MKSTNKLGRVALIITCICAVGGCIYGQFRYFEWGYTKTTEFFWCMGWGTFIGVGIGLFLSAMVVLIKEIFSLLKK